MKILALMWLSVMLLTAPAQAQNSFRKLAAPQYIAALGDPSATSGQNASAWGLWPNDPGPRGVWLKEHAALMSSGTAPSGWRFDPADWWLEEHGVIMERPSFPLPPGKYVVTGGREVTAILTVHPPDAAGNRRWELSKGTLYDVTHLPCRSARYTPLPGGTCSPAAADPALFPVEPGATMPPVEGCAKQDYAVLFVIGVEA